MDSRTKIEDRILARVNKEIGSDFKNLHRAAILVEDYKNQLEQLKAKVTYYFS